MADSVSEQVGPLCEGVKESDLNLTLDLHTPGIPGKGNTWKSPGVNDYQTWRCLENRSKKAANLQI